MTTELQRQVQKLRNTVTQSSSLSDGRASLFLEPKEAASVDIDVIFDAAYSGLVILQQYDDRFSQFSQKLLHSSSQSIQRELLTSKVKFHYFVMISIHPGLGKFYSRS